MGSLIYGPAVPRIYRECKKFGFQPIFEPDKPVLDAGLESFLKDVADVLLPIDAYQLELITRLTHGNNSAGQSLPGCFNEPHAGLFHPRPQYFAHGEFILYAARANRLFTSDPSMSRDSRRSNPATRSAATFSILSA